MKLPQRFAYHGTSTLLSGQVQRPGRTYLDAGGASSLPANGGVSRAAVGRRRFGTVLGFQSGSTHAEGAAHTHQHGSRQRLTVRSLYLHAHAHGDRASQDRTSHAHAGAEVARFFLNTGPVRITARRIRAELTALCACEAKQPSIGTLDHAVFEGVSIGRHTLKITVDRAFFREHDTHAKLCAACMGAARSKAPRAVLTAPRSRADGAPVLTTIVRRLQWEGRPYPGASIDHHAVTIPGVGQIFFGEMIVKGPTRRLTMLRFALDGTVVMHGACCEVEAGGHWIR